MRKNAHLAAGESRWLPVSVALVAALLVAPAAHASPKQIGAEARQSSDISCPALPNDTAWTRSDVSRRILGGAPSALDRIRETQQLAPAADPVSRPASIAVGPGDFQARMTLEPASNAPISLAPRDAEDCSTAESNRNSPSIFENVPGIGAAHDPEAELGTKAIPVKRTRFDDRWDRVRRAAPAGLMRIQLRRANATPSLNEQELLARVNQWVNQQIAYVNDDRNYRQNDFWATAEQTIARGSGDCEDYAILKMHLLRAAGVDADRMKLVLLRDLAANADHAFLLVQTASGKVVLDNMTDRVYDGSHPNSVRPVLSFSENRRWVHAYRGAQPSPNLASLPASQKSFALARND